MLRRRACDVAVSAAHRKKRGSFRGALLSLCFDVSEFEFVCLSLSLSAHPTPPGWLCCAPRPFEAAVLENGLRLPVLDGWWIVNLAGRMDEVHCSSATLCSGRIYEDARAAGGVGGGGRMRAVGGWETDQTACGLFLPRQPPKPVEGKFSPHHVGILPTLASGRLHSKQARVFRASNGTGCFSSAPVRLAVCGVPRAARRLVTTEAPLPRRSPGSFPGARGLSQVAGRRAAVRISRLSQILITTNPSSGFMCLGLRGTPPVRCD